MNKIRKTMKSIRFKLFSTICVVIVLIVFTLILVNNVVLEKYYLYNKTRIMRDIYQKIDYSYNDNTSYKQIEKDIKTLAIYNNLDILVKTDNDVFILATDKYNKDYTYEIENFNELTEKGEVIQNLYKEDAININVIKDDETKINFIVVKAKLNNGYELYMKTPTADIKESARISNNVLIYVGSVTIIVSGVLASVISRKFASPILELNDIAKKMSNLDFSQKYQIDDENEDEINDLGKSINIMSEKLESTIKKLTTNNTELEKDIERKSKIEEIRKQFISDVSHELKTPIALIQGYAEGLVENVNADDESREFYANVILDEANKMDKLVRQLLELMKIEAGKLELHDSNFDISVLINEVLKKCNVMLQENNMTVNFDNNNVVMVNADPFYVEQILLNYITNAIKYSKEINGERKIDVNININAQTKKVRINIFNTGDGIPEEQLQRIWGRFYKIDSSRNREKGGSGIGLAYVRAIMNNYKNEYGAVNKTNGVEFYFELNMEK